MFAHLAAQCPDAEARKQLEEELYGPPGGWDAAEKRLRAAIMAAPDPGAVS